MGEWDGWDQRDTYDDPTADANRWHQCVEPAGRDYFTSTSTGMMWLMI